MNYAENVQIVLLSDFLIHSLVEDENFNKINKEKTSVPPHDLCWLAKLEQKLENRLV